jgi:hypothetical protein
MTRAKRPDPSSPGDAATATGSASTCPAASSTPKTFRLKSHARQLEADQF